MSSTTDGIVYSCRYVDCGSGAEHRDVALLDACRLGDIDAAARFLDDHLASAASTLIDFLAVLGAKL